MERFERFTYEIGEISKYWHRLTTEAMAKYGLKGSHSIYLLALLGAEEGLTAPQLCDRCGKDKADVSRMMKILIDNGFVVKDGTHQNKYGGSFKLTDLGQQAAKEVHEKSSRAVAYAGRELTQEQRETFYYALDSIVSHLKIMDQEGLISNEN